MEYGHEDLPVYIGGDADTGIKKTGRDVQLLLTRPAQTYNVDLAITL